MSADSLARPSPAPVALSLKRNFCWTLAGNVIYAGCQWAMLMVLAKLGNPEMVGQFSLGLAITAPVMAAANLQLRGIQVTDVGHEYRFQDYLGLRLACSTLALFIIVCVAFAGGRPLDKALTILIIGFAKAVESWSDIIHGLLQQYERMNRIAWSMILKGTLSLAGLTLCVYLTRSIVIGVAGYALIWVVVLFTYDMRSAFIILRNLPPEAGGVADGGPHHMVFIRPRWMFRNMARIIGISLPLGLATMLNSLNFNIPRYFISSYWGERELGFFSAMAYVQVAGTVVVGALAISALPRLTKYYAEGNRRSFLVLSTRLLCISIVLGLGGIAIAAIAGKPLLIYFYRPEYAEHISVFIGMMTVAGATYVAASLQNVLIAVRAFNVQLPLFAVLAIVTTVASALLVPSSGMKGAVIAQLISALVQVLLSLVLAARAIHHMRSESV